MFNVLPVVNGMLETFVLYYLCCFVYFLNDVVSATYLEPTLLPYTIEINLMEVSAVHKLEYSQCTSTSTSTSIY